MSAVQRKYTTAEEEIEKQTREHQTIAAEDDFNFQFENKDRNSIFILVTDGKKVAEAKVLLSNESLVSKIYGNIQIYIWTDQAREVELEMSGLIFIVEANMDKDIKEIDFGTHCPRYFITTLPQDKLLFFEWDHGELNPQRRKKAQDYDSDSLSRNITKEDILARLRTRTEMNEWITVLAAKLSEAALS